MKYADACCSYTEIFSPGHKYVFIGPCICCKNEIRVLIAAPELYAYRKGAYIQEALSNNADEREFLMSGICPACWKKMFSTDDEIIGDDPNEDCPVDEKTQQSIIRLMDESIDFGIDDYADGNDND